MQQSFFDLDAATRSARESLARDPNFVAAQVQLAKLLFGAGRAGAAQELAQTTVELAPDDADVQSLLGFIQLAQAKSQEAVLSFQRSIRLESNAAEPRLGLGISFMRQGLYDEAITEILSAAALEPRLAHYQSYLGKAFYEKRDFEQAFTALASAMELDPRDPTPHLYSGIFENDLNRPGQAVRSLQTSIQLNDNRAVYRSRFVLDQDQSTRNVQLATSFNRLGLTNWANVEGVRSNLTDPTNNSAHLLLAGTFLNLPGRTGAAGSELLYTRLLMPVNANSFNSFNDYTTLYESPSVNFTAGGSYASFAGSSETIIASGGGKRWAFGINVTHDREQGFREINGDTKSYTGFGLFKYALGPKTDFLLSYSKVQLNSGDRGGAEITHSSSLTTPFPEDPFFIDEPYRFPEIDGVLPFLSTSDGRDPNLRVRTDLERFEAGFHHRFRPGNDVIVLFSARESETVTDTVVRRNNQESVPVGETLNFLRSVLRVPNMSLQAAHLLKLDRYRLKYGVDISEGRFRARENTILFDNCGNGFFFDCEPSFFPQEFSLRRKEVNAGTAFVQGDVEIGKFVINGGLNYDWASDDNVFVGPDSRLDLSGNRGVDTSIRQWNPQGGVLFRANSSLFVRFAAARSLQPLTSGISGGAFVRERLVPAHLNGFILNVNETELTRSELYEGAVDYRWRGNTFFQIDGFFREKTTPVSSTRTLDFGASRFVLTTPDLFQGDMFGGRATVSHLLTEQLSLTGQYLLTDDDLSGLSRRDHDLSAKLFWVTPSGLSVRLTETYFRQDGRLGGTATHSKVYLTDAEIRYELPRKVGLLLFRAENIFHRHYRYIVDPLALFRRTPARRLEVRLQFSF